MKNKAVNALIEMGMPIGTIGHIQKKWRKLA